LHSFYRSKNPEGYHSNRQNEIHSGAGKIVLKCPILSSKNEPLQQKQTDMEITH